MTENVSPEMVERMIALVWSGQELPAFSYPPGHPIGGFFTELRAIAAELPAPVDPDLVEARSLSIQFKSGKRLEQEILAGMHDEEEAIQALLAAIKRGRTLATQGDR